MFAHFKKIVSCNSMTRYPQIKEEPFSFGVLENWLMLGRDAPGSFGPSHPRSCREAGIPSRPSPSEPLRGRRTRKPPTGARSKEVRNVETQGQQYKNRFLTSHGSPPYRHAVDTIHANLPRRMLHRVSPCVYRCRPPGVQLFAPSCTSCRPC